MMNVIHKNWFYSKTYDFYGLLPMKTGSTLLMWILSHFDFIIYTRHEKSDGSYRDFVNDSHAISHDCYVPEEIINPKTIMSVRNPYTRLLSHFFFSQRANTFDNPTPQEFTSFLLKLGENNRNSRILNAGLNISPTHLIKQENLYDDLIKVDFIRYSDLNTCGILKTMCSKKLNTSNYAVNKSEFLNDYNKSLIYELMKQHFEKFDYEK